MDELSNGTTGKMNSLSAELKANQASVSVSADQATATVAAAVGALGARLDGSEQESAGLAKAVGMLRADLTVGLEAGSAAVEQASLAAGAKIDAAATRSKSDVSALNDSVRACCLKAELEEARAADGEAAIKRIVEMQEEQVRYCKEEASAARRNAVRVSPSYSDVLL